MKLKLFNLILTTVMSIVVLGLLIYVGYAWYVSSNSTTATDISFSTQEGADIGYEVTVLGSDGKIISAPVIPDEVTMLTIELRDTSAKSLDVSLTPKLAFKEVVRDNNTNLITSVKTVVSDPNNITDSITKTTALDKYYLVDEYYTYTMNGTTPVKGDKVYNLTAAQKQEIFTSFYEKYTYNLISKLKYYVSDTLYTSDQYKTELIDKIGGANNIFTDVSAGINFTVNITEDSGIYKGKKYIYLYFDPTDEVFPYGLSSGDAGYNASLANYCFFGQNPYFYQTVKFDVLTVSN